MKSKRGNSRFYFVNSRKIIPKSKRSQSEIITTVLIILLVLAAIVIVWQVVQGTIGAGKDEINKKKDCLGLDVVVLKAIASKGTCTYIDAGAAGSCDTDTVTALNQLTLADVVLKSETNKGCPTITGCTFSGWAQTIGSEGSITVRREGTSTAKGITTQLLINDQINQSSSTKLDTAYATAIYKVLNLKVSDEVQITPLLTDNTACGLTEKTPVAAA